jgi:type IV pilus assembly protein PilA
MCYADRRSIQNCIKHMAEGNPVLGRIRKAMEEREEGFTLIELLVVIIIIGILAAIAIPIFLNQRKKGYDAQAKSDLRNLATLQETYFTDNGKYQVFTDTASAKLALTDYKPSSNVTKVTAQDYTAALAKNTAQDIGGYCMTALSTSGTTWVYDSVKGGLQASGATCP